MNKNSKKKKLYMHVALMCIFSIDPKTRTNNCDRRILSPLKIQLLDRYFCRKQIEIMETLMRYYGR